MSFTFKQFHIDDSHCAMKIGTDGVLLGAWTAIGDALRVLDVGAGSGLISLMLAQRAQSELHITACEINSDAVTDCCANVGASPWNNVIEVVECDCLGLNGMFDLIVSNPPFFNGSPVAPDSARATARQGLTLNYESLIKFAAEHLTETGSLAMVSEFAAKSEIVFSAEMSGLKLCRFCAVKSRPDKDPIRALWQFSRIDGPIENSELVIRDANNRYTENYKSLTSQFYLDK